VESDHIAAPSQSGLSGSDGGRLPGEDGGLVSGEGGGLVSGEGGGLVSGEGGGLVSGEGGGPVAGEIDDSVPRAGPVPHSRCLVPPGSSALREFLTTVVSALDVQPPNEARDIAAYRYLLAARARAVRHTARRLLDDRQADDEDVMIAVWSLRDQLTNLTPTYVAHPLAS
jgi:hypothetical protein